MKKQLPINKPQSHLEKLQKLGMSEQFASELLDLHKNNFWNKSDLLEMVEILKEAYTNLPDEYEWRN